jgi:hypothetical protein
MIADINVERTKRLLTAVRLEEIEANEIRLVKLRDRAEQKRQRNERRRRTRRRARRRVQLDLFAEGAL